MSHCPGCEARRAEIGESDELIALRRTCHDFVAATRELLEATREHRRPDAPARRDAERKLEIADRALADAARAYAKVGDDPKPISEGVR
jgi:hypothetical protein